MSDCCNAWTKAQEAGTDNEGYGQLLRFWESCPTDNIAGWLMGTDLPSIKFCPWCGATVPTTVRP